MTTTPIKLSDTARAMLTLAASREGRLVRPPQLPIAAARQVVRSLLNNGLVEEVPAPVDDAAYAWRTGEDGAVLILRATTQGLMAIGEAATQPADLTRSTETFTQLVSEQGQPPHAMVQDQQAAASTQPETATKSPTAPYTTVSNSTASNATANTETRPEASQPPPRARLRQAALALLEVWSNAASRAPVLDQPMTALRLALGERTPRTTTAEPRKPRENTKQAQVLAMLRRVEGTTIAQIIDVMNWQSHTVRGFLAGLKKCGVEVLIHERVRQVGPNHQGAKGSYTVYRIAGAG